MTKLNVLRGVAGLGILVMLISLAVIPEGSPWYYDMLLFNVGLWPWLLAKRELKKMNQNLNVQQLC